MQIFMPYHILLKSELGEETMTSVLGLSFSVLILLIYIILSRQRTSAGLTWARQALFPWDTLNTISSAQNTGCNRYCILSFDIYWSLRAIALFNLANQWILISVLVLENYDNMIIFNNWSFVFTSSFFCISILHPWLKVNHFSN